MRGHYDGGDTTGFVSPAQDHLEQPIDLAEILDLRRPSRYLVRVAGHALSDRGILHGDLLVADAAGAPAAGRIGIAFARGEVLLAVLEESDRAAVNGEGSGGDGPCALARWKLRFPGAEGLVPPDEVEIWAIATALIRERL